MQTSEDWKAFTNSCLLPSHSLLSTFRFTFNRHQRPWNTIKDIKTTLKYEPHDFMASTRPSPHLTTCVTITIASTELIWNTFVRLLLAITFASTRWFAINIFMANIIFIKHLKFWAEVGVRKRHPTDSYDDTLRVHSRQCHCLPICFSTSALTNSQKQEPINSDCETSWLV